MDHPFERYFLAHDGQILVKVETKPEADTSEGVAAGRRFVYQRRESNSSTPLRRDEQFVQPSVDRD